MPEVETPEQTSGTVSPPVEASTAPSAPAEPRLLLSSKQIAPETLRRLSIRFSTVVAIANRDPVLTGYVVSNAAIKKLRDDGYVVSDPKRAPQIGPDGQTVGEFNVLSLSYRDGVVCRAGDEPANVKIIDYQFPAGTSVDLITKFKEAVARCIKPLFNRNITVVDGSAAVVSPNNDPSVFRIVIRGSGSEPRNAQNFYTTDAVFGVSIGVSSLRCQPWVDGSPIIDPTNGVEIGAFDHDNLYLYVNLFSNQAVNIVDQVFEHVATAIRTPVEHSAAAFRQLYVTECTKRFKHEIDRLELEVCNLRNKMLEAQQTIAQCSSDILLKNSALFGLKSGSLDTTKLLGDEFDRLGKLKAIEAVSFRGTSLVVNTVLLLCRNPDTGVTHEIGKFRIVVDVNVKQVFCFNKTRTVAFGNSQMHAPHVFPGGALCMGSAGEGFAKLIGSYRFFDAIMLALNFLQTVNMDDPAGRRIVDWPVYQPPQGVAQ